MRKLASLCNRLRRLTFTNYCVIKYGRARYSVFVWSPEYSWSNVGSFSSVSAVEKFLLDKFN